MLARIWAKRRRKEEHRNIQWSLEPTHTRSWMSGANHAGSALSNVEPLNASELRHCEIILN